MKAMILAAGMGSRLRPLTDKTPKPLLPIRSKPLIEILIEQLAAAGFSSLVVNLHHLGQQIREYLGDGSRYNVQIEYSQENQLLETGGGIKKALDLLDNRPFIIVNADIYTDFDFSALPKKLPEDALAHLVVKKSNKGQSGDFIIKNNEIESRGNQYTYCGIALMTPELFQNSPEGAFSWTRDWLFDLLGKHRFTSQEHDGLWTDIGTLEQYQSIQ